MDYEKAYKEALEAMSDIIPDENGLVHIRPSDIFHKLKESEDEKIRKALIDLVKSKEEDGYMVINNFSTGSILAWLEKQSNKEYVLKSSKDEDVRKFMQYIEKEAKAYEFNLPNRGYDIYAFAKDILAWLEKQGEQHPTSPKWKYKKDNTPLLRDSIILNKYGCVAKSPSGAIVSDVWVLDYDELAKLPKEEIEKQGEKEQVDGFDAELNALLKKYEHLSKKELQEPLEFYLGVVRDDLDVVREEEKSKWTEEDDTIRCEIIRRMEALDHYWNRPNDQKLIDWLKSLKQRIEQ